MASVEAARAGGPAFEVRRWFVEDYELITAGGRTYAFTKMWGSQTEEAISSLLKAFPRAGITVKRSPED